VRFDSTAEVGRQSMVLAAPHRQARASSWGHRVAVDPADGAGPGVWLPRLVESGSGPSGVVRPGLAAQSPGVDDSLERNFR
jgi:hypothetical protein